MGLLTESGPPHWHPASPELKSACQAAAAYCKEKRKNISKLAMQYSLSNRDFSFVPVGMNSVRQINNREVEKKKGQVDDGGERNRAVEKDA
nr:l-galactose dehydrogenase [Quercus suber]